MEAYAISSANLDVIENNLGAVANELNGVIENVNAVNNQVSVVEEKVSTLDDEIKGLVKEIRETTFITNARQNIMFNNEQIEKKYGYYNKVRRNVLSVIDSVNSSKLDKDYLKDLRQKTLLNNPDYWLVNALASLLSWILDDKETCEKELMNALKKNSIKTKLFFTFSNLKFKRTNVAINWLESYLDEVNPLKLDPSFVEVLELCVNDSFGLNGKRMIIDRITNWINIISSNKKIEEVETNKWSNYIYGFESRELPTLYLDNYSSDKDLINDNLFITSSYGKILTELSEMTKENTKVNFDSIIKDVIKTEEKEEKEFEEDNFRNKLIIECNGNKEKAEELFQNQKSIYENETNIISIFNNIVMYPERYNISENTRKFVLCFVRKYIKKSYEKINEGLVDKTITANIEGYNLNLDNNTTMSTINSDIDKYVNVLFGKDEKIMWVFLILINLIGVVGIFLVLSNVLLLTVLILLMIFGNVIMIYKMIGEITNTNTLKNNKRRELMCICERAYAENKDYLTSMKENKDKYNKLMVFLDNLDIKNFINSNERNIDIG